MIVIAAIIIGAGFGWYRASRIGGNVKDCIQFAAVHAIILGMVGMFISIWLLRANL